MVDSVSNNQPAHHVQDADTQAGSTSTELELRRRIAHSPLPVESALTTVFRESAGILRQSAQHAPGADLTQDQIDAIAVLPERAPDTESTPAAMDKSLLALQHRYTTEDKHPVFDEAGVLAYAREAQAQRRRPLAEQDWNHASTLWSHVQIDRLPYDRKSGDMLSSQIYITTANLAPLLTTIPALMTLASSKHDLTHDAVVKASEGLGVQAGMMVAAPLLMAFLRVMLLPAMENTRLGSPMRSKEMKTRDLPTIVADMRTLDIAMKKLTATLEKAHADLTEMTERGAEIPAEFMARFASASETMTAHSQKLNDLSEEYVTKGETDKLNDVFTTWRTRVGMLQVGSALLSSVVSAATKNAKIGAAIQVSGTGAAMLSSQGITAPWHALFGDGAAPTMLIGAGANDDALKQDATIFATAASSNLLVPAARDKTPEAITVADLDLSDFGKQWKGPMGVGVAQVEEYLNFNIKMKEQEVDALLGLGPGLSKKLEALEAIPQDERTEPQNAQLDAIRAQKKTLVPESDEHARFVALRGERDELKRQKGIVSAGEQWTSLDPAVKKVLHDALADGSVLATLRHTVRLGLVRMAQPSDFIPQVVQLMAAAVQLWGTAGRAFPLLAQAAFREAGAPNTEQGKPSPIPDPVRYTIAVLAAVIGVWGVMSAPHLIREKIAQRNDMRAAASTHGEKFGKLQSLTFRNLGKAGVNLFHAMHISVTGPLRQRSAANASKAVTRQEAETRKLLDQLTGEMARVNVAPQ